MGIIYHYKNKGYVEARTESIIISIDSLTEIEVNYNELDLLEELVEKAQEVRRDKYDI